MLGGCFEGILYSKKNSVSFNLILGRIVYRSISNNRTKTTDNMNSLIFTGLSWFLYYVAEHPEIQNKVYEELVDVLEEEKVTHENISSLK